MRSRVRVKTDWPNAGREAVLLFTVRPYRGGTSGEDWSIVLWDDSVELEPEVHKTRGLEPADALREIPSPSEERQGKPLTFREIPWAGEAPTRSGGV